MQIQRLQPSNLFHTVEEAAKINDWIEHFSNGFDASNKVYAMTMAYVVWNSVCKHYNEQLDTIINAAYDDSTPDDPDLFKRLTDLCLTEQEHNSLYDDLIHKYGDVDSLYMLSEENKNMATYLADEVGLDMTSINSICRGEFKWRVNNA